MYREYFTPSSALEGIRRFGSGLNPMNCALDVPKKSAPGI